MRGHYAYTCAADVRDAFWLTFFVDGKPAEYYGLSQNDLPCDVRCGFVEFVDSLARDGSISQALAQRVTL
jgi:hypothetical protein